jgi:hypothetical protein
VISDHPGRLKNALGVAIAKTMKAFLKRATGVMEKMNTKRLFRISILIFTLWLTFQFYTLSMADVAPSPITGLGGIEPFQYQHTEVQMIYERVEMELLTSRWIPEEKYTTDEDQIKVVAWFVMQNTGNVEEKMQAVFPLGSFNVCGKGDEGVPPSYNNDYWIDPDSFTVQIDSYPVTVTQITTPHPSCNDDYNKMDWAAFYVSFPVGQDVLIRVEYNMRGDMGYDPIQNMQYVLETGAAWKGPIAKGHIIFRFPQVVSREQILSSTTDGYQILYNEIFWSFQNLEPTHNDNILISVISPHDWQAIDEAQRMIKKDPSEAKWWMRLAGVYWNISHYHGPNVREENYAQKVHDVYQQAIAVNPDNSALYIGYVSVILDECCYYGPAQADDLERVLPLLDKALRLEPSNEQANAILTRLRTEIPNMEYIAPPTYTPSITPTPTETLVPTETLTPTITKTPSNTPEPHTSTVLPSPTFTEEVKPTLTYTTKPIIKIESPTVLPLAVVTTTPPVNSAKNSQFLLFGGTSILVIVMLLMGLIVLSKVKR